MDRQFVTAQPCLRGLMLATLTLACARAPFEPLVIPERDSASDGRSAGFEASPSAAAPSLPPGASYRVALASDGTLAVALLGADRRLLGRMAIAAGAGPHASPGVRVQLDDLTGPSLMIEAWSSAGALHGQAFVNGHAVAWRVRLEADGTLVPERWSLAHRGAINQLATLHRARDLAADLRELARQQSHSPVLADRIALAELAIELSLRAWTGHARAHLPNISASS